MNDTYHPNLDGTVEPVGLSMRDRPTLTELGNKHGTDKSSFHGFTDIYARYFEPLRDKPIKLLEIGIAGGASMRMWLEYFQNAEVLGIDHCSDFAHHNLGPRGFQLHGDVRHKKLWEKLADRESGWQFDIVVDDGAHYSDAIIEAFNGAWPLLKPGGLYCVEDLHFLYAQEIGHGAKSTAFDFFQEKMHQMHERGAMQCGRPQGYSDIKFMHWSKSLLIMGKR